MRTRLSRTLSTNVAIAGLAVLVLGAGGTTAALAAGHSPTSKPDTTHATETSSTASAEPTDSESPEPQDSASPEASESPGAQGTDSGTRPTDTHGFCVSRVAQAAPTTHTGTGSSTVNHGTLVSAAAHACGKPTPGATPSASPASTPSPTTSPTAKTHHGKAFGKNHGTGRPAAVTPANTTH